MGGKSSTISRFNFKGDTEMVELPHLEFIEKVLVERGFKGTDVLIEQVGAPGDNYMSNIKRIVITQNGIKFKMIAKLAPAIAMMRKTGNIATVFNNEHVIYTKILPKFQELQRNAGVPKEEWFRFAECYGTNIEAPNEVILLEDLKEDNYVMLDRFKPLNNDCVKIVLKNLAIYHSMSHVLRHLEPETFVRYNSELRDMVRDMGKNDEAKLFMSQIEDNALSAVQDEKYQKFVRGSLINMINYAEEAYKVDKDSKYSVIQQGDGWTNNILFQMENDTPKACALIDYQMARLSNPAYDIMYMLFSSTRHEQRQKHYYEFLDYYHSEMAKSLKYHGLDIASVYPREQLDADLKRYAQFMLASNIFLFSFMVRNTEDASKFIETVQNKDLDSMREDPEVAKAMSVQNKDTLLLFKNLIEGVIDSYIEFGLLHD